jgi:acetolactate synthase I/II/III large subunit
MNGAESLIHTALNAGLEICFANPGTTEMPLVRALDDVPGLRTVLCLFEGVCAGAADGYGRMAEKPALTLLHLGPGFANGIAYFHDARRARTPIVNLIGDHATWHLGADAPLTSDIESLARPVSTWLRRNRSAEKLGSDLTEAIAAATRYPGFISTLIVPHDCQLEPASGLVRLPANAPPQRVEEEELTRAIELFQQNQPTALFLGGHALQRRGLVAAGRIAAVTGCKLICETFPARLERGGDLPRVERLPYFPEQALALLEPFSTIILAGAKTPVSFFGYPGVPSYFIREDQQQHVLAEPHEDVVSALETVAEALSAPGDALHTTRVSRPARPTGALTPETLAAAVAALQPRHAIIMDEGNTSSGAYLSLSQTAPPHSYLTQPGGAIGLGLPCATGAALACPDRRVINIQADGSAMYTLQALWTQAREALAVTTIICNNRSYRILGLELRRAGVQELGPVARSMVSLTQPPLDWVHLSHGLGVPATRATTADELVAQLERALVEPGPHLIEAVL